MCDTSMVEIVRFTLCVTFCGRDFAFHAICDIFAAGIASFTLCVTFIGRYVYGRERDGRQGQHSTEMSRGEKRLFERLFENTS